jgi:hypothetical protein
MQLDEEDNEYEDDWSWPSDSEDYDMENYDSDGESLTYYDEDGQTQVKLFNVTSDGKSFNGLDGIDEFDYGFSLGYASAYRQTRQKLQTTKVNRDWKVVGKIEALFMP